MLDLKREIADIGDKVKEAVFESIEETKFILGPHVKQFEEKAANYLGTKYAIGVGSGTDALHLALRAAGIKEGDEVITTPFTFIATAEAIVYCGAKPVFVDIDFDTMNIDAKAVAGAVTSKTKAVLPVHLFGNPCDMDEIVKIAKDNNLLVIEDCAQSFGATYKGRYTGAIGDVGCFSFFPSKNLGCYGDGGLVVTDDEKIYKEIIALRNHGSYERYYHERIGYNSRLDDIQAAILNVKLDFLEKGNSDRIDIANKYRENIGDCVQYQKTTPGSKHVYHQFSIVADNRDNIISELQKNDVASAIYYPIPLHLQKSLSYLQYGRGKFPNAEMLASKILSLPMNPYLEDEEITIISEIVKLSVK